MHLLNTATLQLEEFLDSAKTPEYAILSHTWGDDEVLFKDMQHPDVSLRKAKKGWAKVQGTCNEARARNLGYAWIDSCCIDKSSSAELSEAINSMFLWYQEAKECYAYIEDMPRDTSFSDFDRVVDHLRRSRWFTRSWTLQELLAPSDVTFYNTAWVNVGPKNRFAQEIAAFSKIDVKALLGTRPLSSYSIAQRMSWAAGRKATRIEDRAYSLFGIFDVNMPPLYGERTKAFRRLQEEIMKTNTDLSILCWNSLRYHRFAGGPAERYHLLAPTPDEFEAGSEMNLEVMAQIGAMITPRGLHFPGYSVYIVGVPHTPPDAQTTMMPEPVQQGDLGLVRYALPLTVCRDGVFHGIYLRKIGYGRFVRDLALPIAIIPRDRIHPTSRKRFLSPHEREIFITMHADDACENQVPAGLHMPFLDVYCVLRNFSNRCPDMSGLDCINRVVYQPRHHNTFSVIPLLASVQGVIVELLCLPSLIHDFEQSCFRWFCFLVHEHKHPDMFDYLTSLRPNDEKLLDLVPKSAGLGSIKNYVDIKMKGKVNRITVSIKGPGLVPHVSKHWMIWVAGLEVSEV